MENRSFHIPGHSVEARLRRLRADQVRALDQALEILSQGGEGAADRRSGNMEGLPTFLLPLAEFGLSAAHIVKLAEKVPEGFPLDHREIYFDFRLDRWIRHIEPPTIAESLDAYLESAGTAAEGMAYLEAQWRAFLRRQGGADTGGRADAAAD